MVLDCLLGCRQEYETGERILDCCCLGPSLKPLSYFTPFTFMLSLSLSLCLHLGFSFMMLEIEARAPKYPRQILCCWFTLLALALSSQLNSFLSQSLSYWLSGPKSFDQKLGCINKCIILLGLLFILMPSQKKKTSIKLRWLHGRCIVVVCMRDSIHFTLLYPLQSYSHET